MRPDALADEAAGVPAHCTCARRIAEEWRGSARRARIGVAISLAAIVASGCGSVYYGAWERLGREKRDLLRAQVEDVREEQAATGEQLGDALERLRAVYGSSGSPLEPRYDALRGEYEDAEARAEALRGRIRRARTTAGDLFDEWDEEIGSMQDRALARRSREQLSRTRERWKALDAALRRSEKSLDPVLAQLRDQVLFLKHNLNAQALGTVEAEVGAIGRDVDALVADMRRASAEAERFLAALGTG